jgi:branched-chain amino acid transport system substrate-binding protein
MLPLSGPLAAAGTVVNNGLHSGTTLINESGGIDGRQIQLVTENTQSDPAVAVSEAKGLIAEHVVAMLYAGFSDTLPQTAPIFDKYQIPMIQVETNDLYHDPYTYPYLFPVGQPDSSYMQTVAEATTALGIGKVAILTSTDPLSSEFAALYEAYAKEAGISIVSTIKYPVTAVDVTTQIEEAKATGVNAVALMADAGLSQVYKAMQSVGWTPTIMGNEFTPAEGWADLVKTPVANTTYYPCTAALPSTTATYPSSYRSVLQALLKAQGFETPGDGGIGFYESVLVLKDAIEHAGTSGPAIKSYLETYQNKNFGSPYDTFTYSSTDHRGGTVDLLICKAPTLGDLNGSVYDVPVETKIQSTAKLPFVPEFGPGAPSYVH